MKVYTYFQTVPGRRPDKEYELIAYWANSWKLAGWEPVVFSLEQAQQHPRWEELQQRFRSYPAQQSKQFEEACFFRWAAFHACTEGGFFADYDVINYGWTPPASPPSEDIVFFQVHPRCKWPSLVYASSTGLNRLLTTLERFSYTLSDGMTITDMSIFNTTWDELNIRAENQVAEATSKNAFPNSEYSWPLVHYCAGWLQEKRGTHKIDYIRHQRPVPSLPAR